MIGPCTLVHNETGYEIALVANPDSKIRFSLSDKTPREIVEKVDGLIGNLVSVNYQDGDLIVDRYDPLEHYSVVADGEVEIE